MCKLTINEVIRFNENHKPHFILQSNLHYIDREVCFSYNFTAWSQNMIQSDSQNVYYFVDAWYIKLTSYTENYIKILQSEHKKNSLNDPVL